MTDLQSRLADLTDGATRGLAVEREVEHLGLWLLDVLEEGLFEQGEDGLRATGELVFRLRTPRRGARIDSCEIDVEGTRSSTTSALLTRVAPRVDQETLHECAALLLDAALERLDPRVLLGERAAVTVRVGEYEWTVEGGSN